MGAISALIRKRSVWHVELGIAAIIVPIGYANGIGFMVACTFPSAEPAISIFDLLVNILGGTDAS